MQEEDLADDHNFPRPSIPSITPEVIQFDLDLNDKTALSPSRPSSVGDMTDTEAVTTEIFNSMDSLPVNTTEEQLQTIDLTQLQEMLDTHLPLATNNTTDPNSRQTCSENVKQ